MKNLTDLQTDAVMLHALCQGAVIIYEAAPEGRATPATNALVALLDEITDKASALSNGLCELKASERRAAA